MDRICIPIGEDRSHTIYRYTDQIYKVIQFYKVRQPIIRPPPEEVKHYDQKLDSSLSRTKRVILEKALCNPWEWFCTFTISDDQYDRKDLLTWRDSFTQWIRDQRKKGLPICYLLVPERHADGSWHAHGLFYGLGEDDLITFREMDRRGYRTPEGRRLPRKLIKSNYYNWPLYQKKFGFCSFGRIKSPVASGFYISKYITKENDRMVQEVGLHSYYASKGLQGATKHLDFFGRDPEIDRLLVNKYDFCATGMTHLNNSLDWSFGMNYVDFKDLEPLSFTQGEEIEKSAPEIEADDYYEFEQLMLKI